MLFVLILLDEDEPWIKKIIYLTVGEKSECK